MGAFEVTIIWLMGIINLLTISLLGRIEANRPGALGGRGFGGWQGTHGYPASWVIYTPIMENQMENETRVI